MTDINDRRAGTLIYLHGFLSTPNATKARILRDKCASLGIAFEAPDLNMSPLSVEKLLDALIEKAKTEGPVYVTGASLGGFFAARMHAKHNVPAALLNPAVRPWRVVSAYTGEQKIYGSERTLNVLPEFADELRALDTEKLTDPEKVLMVLATGDEVLDWREAAALYSDAESVIIDGGSHRIDSFEEYADVVMSFLTSH